jgi:hypothetical protein
MDKRLEFFLGSDWFAYEGHDIWDTADWLHNPKQTIWIHNQHGKYKADIVRNSNDVVIQVLTHADSYTRLGDTGGSDKWKTLRSSTPIFEQIIWDTRTKIGQFNYPTWTLLHKESNEPIIFVRETDENDRNPLPWKNK